MKNKSDLALLITLNGISGFGPNKVNKILAELKAKAVSLDEFFNLKNESLSQFNSIKPGDYAKIETARNEIPNNSFQLENLLDKGFHVLSIYSDDYPEKLKENMPTESLPPVIYAKGNLQIFKEKSIAIVGSRDAMPISLQFADNIAQKASKEFNVIVSGFAKGIDKQALDSAIKYTGQSIIVLPQGILTFSSGFNTYHSQIVEGNVLVISTFPPNAGWDVGYAMTRNLYIYGLASSIYVAQSANKGGTWEGVIDGLKRSRPIYVRKPEANENNSNEELIKKGAVPVDFNGNVLASPLQNLPIQLKKKKKTNSNDFEELFQD